eukprot:gnl/TRDRNA2_/TRDRNA2_83677_c0_seq1.p1 gnl/TRDRNA2_/TRDRNA2_83677_c0~~gnl/TRDRNA2_/TRDRNA2_83677_c0_seq1.p1  ORF type:complete len:489 (+),score=96.01 gnl/TRDRNA2_/TRDRNA2_83677_c0_seq1:55-1521(+)
MAVPAWATGELIELTSATAADTDGGVPAVTFHALIECRGSDEVALALPGQPYRRLRYAGVGQVPQWEQTFSGGRVCSGKETSWHIQRSKDGAFVTLSPTAVKKSAGGGMSLFLAPAAAAPAEVGGVVVDSSQALCVSRSEFHWRAEVLHRTADDCDPSKASSDGSGDCSVACRVGGDKECGLSEDDLRDFVDKGFVVARSLVPRDVWVTAKAFINGRLGNLAAAGAAAEGAGPPGEASEVTVEEELQHVDPAGEAGKRHALQKVWGSSSWQLLALCHCAPVLRHLERLIGPGCLDMRFGVQVALRFPGIRDDLVAGGAAVRTNVTGRDWHTDGLRQGKKHPFTLLVGIALSDMMDENAGNLCVWPGSHHFTHKHMRWPDGKIHRERGWDSCDGPLPDLGPPQQLKLRAGDVLLAHSGLAHCGGPLLGPDVRYMTYFRVRHKAWQTMCDEGLFADNMWHDLEGLRDVELTTTVEPAKETQEEGNSKEQE